MKQLDEYLKLQKEIYKYFGYHEDWVIIPIDDSREYFWRCDSETVYFSESEETLLTLDGNHYENEIYRQRFLKQWVYRGKEYTMIVVDTHTDGNKFLQIFDNSKEREKQHG